MQDRPKNALSALIRIRLGLTAAQEPLLGLIVARESSTGERSELRRSYDIIDQVLEILDDFKKAYSAIVPTGTEESHSLAADEFRARPDGSGRLVGDGHQSLDDSG